MESEGTRESRGYEGEAAAGATTKPTTSRLVGINHELEASAGASVGETAARYWAADGGDDRGGYSCGIAIDGDGDGDGDSSPALSITTSGASTATSDDGGSCSGASTPGRATATAGDAGGIADHRRPELLLRRLGSVEPDFEAAADVEKGINGGGGGGGWIDETEPYEVRGLGRSTVLPARRRWPFLLRFPVACFGMCLGLGSQTVLWKTLAASSTMRFMHVPHHVNLALWCLCFATLAAVFAAYAAKCALYFEAVRREFCHPVRINFFFAPWIAAMFLALGLPPRVSSSPPHPALWALFMAPIFLLELKIYGQWLSGGEKRLCKVANPCTHLSLVGNFVGSLLAMELGLREMAIFFWAVGLAHYLVLFVTLYQRLPTAAPVPKELHPVFFLFIAAPSIASVAWSKIVGRFDIVSRIAYFVALFLYASLIVRVNLFRGFRFSLAWWAYTFPMTGSAIATIYYSLEVPHPITEVMALVLSVISSVTVFSLAIVTLLHLFWGTLFPNDMAIAASSSAACSAMNAASGCCKSRSKRIRNLNDQLHFEFAHEKPPSKKHHHQGPQQPCATDSVHP